MTVAEPEGLRPLHGLPFWRVPILINSFNRLHSLRRLVDWLLRAGYVDIHVIDNASTYPPLLGYLTALEQDRRVRVTRLAANAGHLAIWQEKLLDRLGIDTEYVYTDPDVVPIEACPRDLVGVLQSVLDDNPGIARAGTGLRLDDLPETYRHRTHAIDWERQFWLRPAAPGLFHAPIDTTLALYRPKSGHDFAKRSIRLGWPYLAAHEGWYLNHAEPSEEDLFYQATSRAGTSHWSAGALPPWLETAAAAQSGCRPNLLYAGRAAVPLPGYRNVPDDGPLPLAAHTVDGIYVDDGVDRVLQDPGLAQELRRVAKPRARLVLHPHLATAAQIASLLEGTSTLASGWRLERLVVTMNGVSHPADHAALIDMVRRRPLAIRRLMAHFRATGGAATASAPPVLDVGGADDWAGFTVA